MLKALAARYPQLAKVYSISIGKSATGTREIWCIEIGNQKKGPAEEKPAAYFDGGQHATEVVGGKRRSTLRTTCSRPTGAMRP